MNQKEFECLLYTITANVADKLMEQNGWGEDESMDRFTQSKVYSFLEREDTKVWHYSTTMLAELFNDERAGRLVFPEEV